MTRIRLSGAVLLCLIPTRLGLVARLTLVVIASIAFAIPAHADDSDPVAVVDSLWTAGLRAEAFKEGTRELRAARAQEDTTTAIRLLIQRGSYMLSVGQAAEADPLLFEALSLARANDEALLACQAIRWQSVAAGTQGRREEARALYAELLDCATVLEQVDLQGWAHVGMGWDAMQRGASAESLEHYSAALEIFVSVGEVWGEVWARNGVAIAQRNLGDLAGARASYQSVIERARVRGATMAEGMGLNNLANLEWSVGDPGKAMQGFAASAELHRRLDQRREALVPRINLARCLLAMGDVAAAQDTLEACLAEARALSSPEHEVSAEEGLGRLHLQEEEWAAAAEHFRRALTRSEGLYVSATRNSVLGLSTALARQDSLEAAIQILLEAQQWCGEGGDPIFCSLTQLALGERELERGVDGAPRALEYLQAAEAMAAEDGIQQLRVGAFTSIAEAQEELGRPDLALAALQRAVEVWEEERSLPEDPEWRALRGTQGRRLFTELAAALLDDPREAFDQLQRYKGRTLMERVAGPLAVGSESRWRLEVGVESMQREVLEGGELFLDLYLGPTVSIAFAVDGEDCVVWELPDEEELSRRMTRLYEEIGARSLEPESFTRIGRALLGDLFGPAAPMIARNEHVFFSVDGALHLLSPALLSNSSGKSWSRIPSGALLAHLRIGELATDPSDGILVLASAVDGDGQQLPAVEAEARWLSSNFDGVELVVDGLAGREVLHLAAHAVADDNRPWRSRLMLAGGGELPASRILEEGSDAHLAVLSSCATARGRILSGEGVQSLSTALLAGGVPCVVATLWPVDDAVTYAFMRQFYRRLAQGWPAMRALQSAQEKVRANADTAQPFYWAGFVLEGEPAEIVELHARRNPWIPSLIAGCGLVLAILVLSWRRA